MKVLIVCSGNSDSISPFVKEQGETGIIVDILIKSQEIFCN